MNAASTSNPAAGSATGAPAAVGEFDEHDVSPVLVRDDSGDEDAPGTEAALLTRLRERLSQPAGAAGDDKETK